ncbi:thioredoxin family protein [Brevibacillus fulvus]|uniref:Thioredoxin-like negative regulator of GroEL n=1 Tax=Brevibacillus fulvus TaxID=1125967 RepID=A0A938XWM7_9BACL|nr:thioredoxin family protein [Brevibacillus fulvus]MBM7589055.1 thioredoxin-like negative regulator of GroEL [Brevibacillus fulvus]
MRLLNREEIRHKQARQETFALLLFTPFCGTCKLAERMLQIIMELSAGQLAICRANINTMPDVAQSWQVQSVPCLLVFSQGREVKRFYALQSVDYLYQQLRPYWENENG